MKTYWLQGKKGPGFRKVPDAPLVQAKRTESKRRKSAAGARSIYSPVTYEEIAKHSPCNTPPPYYGSGSGAGSGVDGSVIKGIVKEAVAKASLVSNNGSSSPKRRTTAVAPTVQATSESNGRPVPRKAAWTELELKVPSQGPVVTAPPPPSLLVQSGATVQPCQHCTHCHTYNQSKLAVAPMDSGDKTGCWSQSHRGGQSALVSGGGGSCRLL